MGRRVPLRPAAAVRHRMQLLIIDNYDSFTFNLYQLVAPLVSHDPIVIKNDEITLAGLQSLPIDAVIISPGPGRPDRPSDFGLSAAILRELDVPILGVCLGHQGICTGFGGAIQHAPEPMHGRIDWIHHDGLGLFAGLPNPFQAVRYHSLICADPLPPPLLRTAWTPDNLTMGLAHRTKPIWGVQFHPESICTTNGQALLRNFLQLAARANHRRPAPATPPLPPARPAQSTPHPQPSRKPFTRTLPLTLPSDVVFETLFGREEIALWLDSALPNSTSARFSILAGGSRSALELVSFDAHTGQLSIHHGETTTTSRQHLFSYLNARLSQEAIEGGIPSCPFNGGFVGYLGYEMKAAFGIKTVNRSPAPDSCFAFVERFVVIDHLTAELHLAYLAASDQEAAANAWFDAIERQLASPSQPAMAPPPQPAIFTPSRPRAEYLDNIAACLRAIRDGESYELCLTNQFHAATTTDPLTYYQRLRAANPAPHAAFLRLPALSVACSSPERFLRVTPSGSVETRPIKGTSPRGATAPQDDALRLRLAAGTKTRAENLMIVDLLRNDLGKVCEPGSVSVPSLMAVESYATLHQLVSTITGQLKPGLGALDCLRAAFPGGSMTGAPKLRTMEIIDRLENEARGVYSGCLGYLSCNGSADFNMVIRTAVFRGPHVSIGAGGAIVALSDPQEEWDEMLLKAQASIRAFGT
jgi:para-aminobenzoate synthetase